MGDEPTFLEMGQPDIADDAKRAGKAFGLARRDVRKAVGDFLLHAANEQELVQRMSMRDADEAIAAAASRHLDGVVSDGKAKLATSLIRDWRTKHSSKVECPRCGGSGSLDEKPDIQDYDSHICPLCRGDGEVDPDELTDDEKGEWFKTGGWEPGAKGDTLKDHDHSTVTVNGLTYCTDKECSYEKYDSQWGAGMFTDWPAGHHKPYQSSSDDPLAEERRLYEIQHGHPDTSNPPPSRAVCAQGHAPYDPRYGCPSCQDDEAAGMGPRPEASPLVPPFRSSRSIEHPWTPHDHDDVDRPELPNGNDAYGWASHLDVDHGHGGAGSYVLSDLKNIHKADHEEGRNTFREARTAKHRVEVRGVGESVWTGNQMEYDSPEEAERAAIDLGGRWMGMDMARVVPVDHPRDEAVDPDDPKIVYDWSKESARAAGTTTTYCWNCGTANSQWRSEDPKTFTEDKLINCTNCGKNLDPTKDHDPQEHAPGGKFAADGDAQRAWRRTKGELTRAEKSGDPDHMLQAVEKARGTFEEHGYPDWWSRVDRLEQDAHSLRQRNSRQADRSDEPNKFRVEKENYQGEYTDQKMEDCVQD